MAGRSSSQSTRARDIAKGTLRNILAIIGMDAEEFRKLLRA
jgi:hypothetical protein